MRFLMLVCRDTVPVEPPATPGGDDVEKWVSTMDGRGLRVTGDMLAPEREASVVRVRNGEVLVTDGPLETKELVGGFDLLECQDMAQAIEVAAAHPFATRGVLEIRPIRAG